MTFALLVPCKNGARFLPRLMSSVRAQTKPFDALWLFDDGSTDDTADVARSLGFQVLTAATSIGPAAARNRLLEHVACDWIHFHDADDTMEPRYLERVALEATPGTDVVVCNMAWVRDPSGEFENQWTYDARALAERAAAYLIGNTVGGINGLYRRDALRRIGGFNEQLRYWEDLDLNVRLARASAKFRVVEENLVTAFRRTDSYSNANLTEVWRVKLRLMAAMLERADAELRDAIINEAELIADRFAILRRWDEVPAALALARRAGGNPPRTASRALALLKHVAPAPWTFWLQWQLRRALQK